MTIKKLKRLSELEYNKDRNWAQNLNNSNKAIAKSQ